MTTLLEQYRSNYSAAQEEELCLDDYLELCKREPAAYASAAERMLAGIGEPEFVDTRNDQRLGRIFGNRVIRRFPAFREFYGMEDAIEQIVAFFRHAAQGLEERKQILYLLGPVGGGKSSIAERLKSRDGSAAHLRAQGLSGQRIAAGPVHARALWRGARGGLRHSAPLSHRHHVAVGDQAPAGIRRRPVAVSRRARESVGAAPGRDHQDRAGRREQPGHLVPGRQGRHPQAGTVRAERSGCLQLLRRAMPRQPGPARIRRDVQGADQDAAPASDRDAGRQLQGHRGLLRDSVQRPHRGPLERIGVAHLPQQQEQRGVSRPHLHRQGAVLRPGVGGNQDLSQAARQLVACRRAVRAGHAGDDGAVLGADAAEGAGELEHLFQDAGVRRRNAEGRRSEGQDAAGVSRLRRPGRGHERPVDALRLQDPVRRCSTTTRRRSPPIPCT